MECIVYSIVRDIRASISLWFGHQLAKLFLHLLLQFWGNSAGKVLVLAAATIAHDGATSCSSNPGRCAIFSFTPRGGLVRMRKRLRADFGGFAEARWEPFAIPFGLFSASVLIRNFQV